MGYQSVQFCWDSKLLIKLLKSEDHFNNPSLNKNLQCIRNTLKDFERVTSFHILRELNNHANLLEIKACMLPLGNLGINGDPSIF